MSIPRAFTLTGILTIAIATLLWNDARTEDASAAPPPAPHAVVLAELFTSEGCSSCPPADALLSRLVTEQPVRGVTVLGLGEHVDYWNDLGWVDPFSSAAFSQRQSDYAARVFKGGPYTPQMVIDGSREEVGSDAAGVTSKIAQAAAVQKAVINLMAPPPETESLQIQINVDASQADLRQPADLVIALTEDNLTTNVRRGENSGRQLHHSAVVRLLHPAGTVPAGSQQWSGTAAIRLQPEWKRADLKLIAFLQEQQSRRIVGADWTGLVPSN
jgi:hypothetical protein